MKKGLFLSIFTVCMLAFVACSGSSSKDNTSGEATTETAAASTGNEWDDILNTYEEYIDTYLDLSKKVMSGDISAMQEYTDYATKIGELAQKMAEAGDGITTEQVERFTKLQQKMVDAAQSMMQ